MKELTINGVVFEVPNRQPVVITGDMVVIEPPGQIDFSELQKHQLDQARAMQNQGLGNPYTGLGSIGGLGNLFGR